MEHFVKRLPENKLGHDYIVGDIHGCYEVLFSALEQVNFNPDKDRLISVGDLVDRGPESVKAIEFMNLPYVHAIRGNHEDMFLNIYAYYEPRPEEVFLKTRQNGMRWWTDISNEEQLTLIKAFRSLPIIIEIETSRGLVGVVHAEVPSGMDWNTFTQKIRRGDPEAMDHALWGRDRIMKGDTSGVEGIHRVYCGHTPIYRPTRLANVFYMDTGAVFGFLKKEPQNGHMTIANAKCNAEAFVSELYERNDYVLAISDEHSPDTTFEKLIFR